MTFTFEIQKTYRTKRGRTAQVCNDHGASHNLPLRIVVLGNAAWARRDGSFQINGEPDWMVHGAIEDEKPEADDIPSAESIRMNNMQAQIDNLKRRIDHHRDRFGDSTNNIYQIKDQLTRHANQIALQREKIGKLEVAAVCDPIIAAREGYAAACTAAVDRAKATKIGCPTIQVGWLNVYYGRSSWHPSREEADHCASPGRAACIEIRNVTDGEGL